MGIYFKGMKMPENCLSCDVNTNYNYCPILRRDTSNIRYDKRFDDCPIVEVKEPHGRLINEDDIDIPSLDTVHDQVLVYGTIREAPTIIEAEGAIK